MAKEVAKARIEGTAMTKEVAKAVVAVMEEEKVVVTVEGMVAVIEEWWLFG